MTKAEVLELIEQKLAWFPERMTGNEINAQMVEQMRPLLLTDRVSLIEALRKLLPLRIPQSQRQPGDAIREARMWLALELASGLGLTELRADVKSLLKDVRQGRAFLPYYEEMLVKYLSASSLGEG